MKIPIFSYALSTRVILSTVLFQNLTKAVTSEECHSVFFNMWIDILRAILPDRILKIPSKDISIISELNFYQFHCSYPIVLKIFSFFYSSVNLQGTSRQPMFLSLFSSLLCNGHLNPLIWSCWNKHPEEVNNRNFTKYQMQGKQC